METLSEIFGFWKDTILGMIGTKSSSTNIAIPTTAPIANQFSIFPVAQQPVTPLLNQVDVPKPEVVKTVSTSFNPNIIISDKEFLDCSSMTEAQIQDFITSKGSFLKDYPINEHLTSYWIYKHCNDLGLNPKVLMTNIQKEQGTISMKVMPKNRRRLDYFCGVGAYDPPRGDDPKWAGVDKQILGAVQVNVRRYNDALKLKFPYSYITDKPEFRKIQIQNASTRSLYSYTPFVGDQTVMVGKNKYEAPFANNLFWYVYNKWFGFSE